MQQQQLQELQAKLMEIKAQVFDLNEIIQAKDRIIQGVVEASGFKPDQHGDNVQSLLIHIHSQRTSFEAAQVEDNINQNKPK